MDVDKGLAPVAARSAGRRRQAAGPGWGMRSADVRRRPDGGAATKMCCNGVRCLARFIAELKNMQGTNSFIVTFSNRAPDPEKDSAAVQEFIERMEGAFRAHTPWAGSSEEELESAGEVISTMQQCDTESWNLMIGGYYKAGCDVKCLELYREMQFRGNGGLLGDVNSLVSAISSCSKLGNLHLGQSVHCYAIKQLVDDYSSVANGLISMYGRCGKFDRACKIFCRTKLKKDVITWNALIASYAHLGLSNDALSMYDRMCTENVKPNSATLLTVISACADSAALECLEQIHSYVKETGLDSDVQISTALVDMYAKCGQLGIYRGIFDSMLQRDVVSWNVMISGYGMHGNAKEALELFSEMDCGNVEPNGVTFLSVLSAYCHAGLVDEGRKLYIKMREYSLEPNLKHYACMVDLLAKSVLLQEAENIIMAMPIEPDGGIWGTLLSACKVHDNF